MNSIGGKVSPVGWSMLLASTALAAAPALAASAAATAADANSGVQISEIIVTSQKREESLQHVAMSVQAFDTRKLEQLNVTNFQDYVKYMPSVGFQTFAPNQTIIYMRGVSDGGNGNHSGPLPSVGAYLDEQPITTIGGTLDIHIYDIARVEVLPGPQGTLYGASSEAGTLRIITNKPSTAAFSAGYSIEGNTVAHGDQGYVLDGFVNVPLSSRAAIRLVAFDERDAGFIDNVPGTRLFATSGVTISNADRVANNVNKVEVYGGRAALKIDLNDSWTIMPTVVAQDTRAPGVFAYNPAVGDLKVNRFQPDSDHDRWIQAAMNITGKIGRFDITYSGGYFNRAVDALSDYTDYSIAYDAYYGSGAYWVDNANNILPSPQQEIIGIDRFEKGSNELRIASPSTDRFRFIVGLFQERQTHWIRQDYVIQGFGSQFAVTGWPNTIWLTDLNRIDRDEAVFGEASFDVTSHITITGGIRGYRYKNTLYGFFGYSAAYSSHTGESQCIPGLTFRDAPCVDADKPASRGSGETHKVNLTYKFDADKLVYFTYSTGFRPGGVNRSGIFPPYQADSLTNYEIGWKTSWLNRSLNWNGAFYDEDFSNFQFAFLGPNSLTIVENAPSARILGVETTVDWRATPNLTLSLGGAYNDAVLAANFCGTDQATGLLIPHCADADALALKGEQLPYTPKFKGNATIRYAFDVMGWNAHAQASVVYQTKSSPALETADIQNLGTMPDYATVDFSFGAERDNKSLEVFIKNAFDERGQVNRYTPCTTSTCAPAYPGAPPAVYVVPTQPLTFGIRFGQKF
jgi:iron complex outermembrane receptor protein